MSDEIRRGPRDTRPDEPGWWMASDNKWYPPESAPSTESTAALPWPASPPKDPDAPTSGNKWLRRHWIALAAAAIALVVGMGVGAAASNKQDELDRRATEIKNLSNQK